MMIDVLLIAVLALSILAVLWPFTLYPLMLRLFPEKPLAPRADTPRRTATMLFCAYNESAAMPAKIANLDAIKRLHPDIQILAFDDGSADDTAAQLAARPDLLTLVRGPGRSGKAHGMKQLARMATGDILIFTDANVILVPEAVETLLGYYADPEIGGVMGSLYYLGEGESATASVGSLYWRLEEHLKDLESRSGNVMGADGSIFSLRRTLYPSFPDTVLDDLTVSMAAVFAGKRLIKARDVVAVERVVASRDDEYRRKVRIAARGWHTHCYLRPKLRAMRPADRFKYVSRKLVRWFGAAFLATGAVAAAALAWRLGGPLLFLGLIALAALLVLAGAKGRGGPLTTLVEIGLAYAATLQGVIRAMRGATFAVWTPAKSR